MSMISFILQYKWVIIFYTLAVVLILANKKKFEIQAKIIALYRTTIGLAFMKKTAERFREWFRVMGYIAVGAGFVGMIYIMYFILKNAYELVVQPAATPAIGIILPGIRVPGSPIFLPFWHGIIAIFLVVVIHEASHGIMSLVHNIRLKSSGFAFFGPIPAAFVEPDEKQLSKQEDIVQYSVFAAGPVSNVVFGFISVFLVLFLITPIQGSMVNPTGISFQEVQEGYPMAEAGITPDMIIYSMNGKPITNGNEFLDQIECVMPDQAVVFGTDQGDFTVITTTHPEGDHDKGYFGIIGIEQEYELKDDSRWGNALFAFVDWVRRLFGWLVMLNFGIGLANLLPLGPVDGGRMLQVFLKRVIPDEKKAQLMWVRISYFTGAVLLFIICFSITQWMFSFIP